MVIYLAMLILSIIPCLFITRNKAPISNQDHCVNLRRGKMYLRKANLAVFLASLPFLFISGFRYAVGTDYWPTYYTGFYRVLNGIDFDRFEYGYLAIVKLTQRFTDNAFVLLFVLSFLFIYFTFRAIKEQSPDILFSVLLLFVTRYFFISMNVVRQFLSMAIALYSMKYILRKQKKKFLFGMFIAFSIHYMAILFLPVYFVYDKKIDIKKFILYGVTAGIIILVLKNIVFIILANTRFGNADRYEYAGVKFTLFTIMLNALICFSFYIQFNKVNGDPRYRLYLNIELIAMIISLFIGTIPAMERVYWIYSFPLIISIPYCIKREDHPILRWLIVAIFIVYLIYDIVFLNDHGVLPYQTIWGHQATPFLWGYQVK